MAVSDLQSIAFPTLDESQIADLSRCVPATPKLYPEGRTLFDVGDRNFKFHVIKSGEVEILDYSGDVPKTLTDHHQGGFTGDTSHLTGNPWVVGAVAKRECEVYEIQEMRIRRS